MAGYKGYSMSNNAVSAYDYGAMPKSKWTKQAILDVVEEIDSVKAEQFKKLTKKQLENLLAYDSWHHTSNHYNKTEFYVVSENLVDQYTYEQLASIKPVKEVKVEEPTNWIAEVQIWGGTRAHPRMLGTEVVSGKRKGDWLITEDGKRYKLSANKTVRYWEEK